MQPLLIGAGPHAREMAAIVEQINGVTPTWDLHGYLVPPADADLVGRALVGEYRALATYDDLDAHGEARLAWAFGCRAPDVDRKRLVTLVAPTAFVAGSARLGAGCVLYPGCFVGDAAVIGDRCFALANAVVNHDDVLGDDVTLAAGAALAGEVTVEDGCYLGQACTVRQGLRIGRGALVGMGAVVVADVEPGSVVVGNPARRLRSREA